jgi:hypothetical protein
LRLEVLVAFLFLKHPPVDGGKGDPMKPDARRERLLLEEVGDELVLYDLRRHRVHQLNRTAALVWQHCDGQRTVAELTKLLQNELDPAINEVLVWQALERLGKAHVLREPLPRQAGAARLTRRQALRKLGQTAALALLMPVITSILAPSPLRADGENNCDNHPCEDACEDQCKKDKDCPKSTPVCRLLSCTRSGCTRCTQRRCTKKSTTSGVGGGDD